MAFRRRLRGERCAASLSQSTEVRAKAFCLIGVRSCFAPHPRFKDLDAYQWLLLNGAHGRRHTAQIAEVKVSESYRKK
jgi:hypothetical protein